MLALRLILLALVGLVCGCIVPYIHDVETAALRPSYLRPIVSERSQVPLVLVYDPKELPDVLQLQAPAGFDTGKLIGARALVTLHLRTGLETLFEQVSVVDDPTKVPPEAVLGKVQFIAIGMAVAEGGRTMVGTLEWSLALIRPGEKKVFYGWSERTTGTREGFGAFGSFDPSTVIQGAIEASLRAMLKDMAEKAVVSQSASARPGSPAGDVPTAPADSAGPGSPPPP